MNNLIPGSIRNEFQRLSDMFNPKGMIDDWWANPLTTPMIGPMAVRMSETNDSVLLEADLPGVDKDDVEVSVDGRQLRISAVRHETTSFDGGSTLSKERFKEAYYGRIERVLSLPNTVESESCNAELKRGVLFLTFKKTPDAKVKKIEVK